MAFVVCRFENHGPKARRGGNALCRRRSPLVQGNSFHQREFTSTGRSRRFFYFAAPASRTIGAVCAESRAAASTGSPSPPARVKGWLTYSFSGHVFQHHRPMGTGRVAARCRRAFQLRQARTTSLGGHPLVAGLPRRFQMTKRPYVIRRACASFAGYVWCWAHGEKRFPVSEELMAFHRREQLPARPLRPSSRFRHCRCRGRRARRPGSHERRRDQANSPAMGPLAFRFEPLARPT
jgi:hypothetical protein